MNLIVTGGRSRGNTSVAESTRDGGRGKDTMVMFVFRSHLLLRQFDHVIFLLILQELRPSKNSLSRKF